MPRGLLAVAGFVLLSASAMASEFSPQDLGQRNQVCIERPGENGRVNIAPVTIIIESSAELTILGEQAVCFFESIDSARIKLRFAYPYSRPTEQPRYWTTAPRSFPMRKGKILHLELCEAQQDHNEPNWVARGWHDMWVLKRMPGSLTDCSL